MYWASWWAGAGVWHRAHSLGLLSAGVVASVTLASKDPVASALPEVSLYDPSAVAVACGCPCAFSPPSRGSTSHRGPSGLRRPVVRLSHGWRDRRLNTGA